MTELSLLDRKELLKILFNKYSFSNIFYSEHTIGNGIEQFEKAQNNNSEGIIAKKADSSYLTSSRSNNWLKIKISNEEEAIIIGITEPKNSRKYFCRRKASNGAGLRVSVACQDLFGTALTTRICAILASRQYILCLYTARTQLFNRVVHSRDKPEQRGPPTRPTPRLLPSNAAHHEGLRRWLET